MKTRFLFILTFFMALTLFGQDREYHAIGELSDGLIAVQQDGKWGFIDTQGNLVIDFRDDLVIEGKAPVFHDGLALIRKMDNGIPYYGYIGSDGATVVKPEYLCTTPFKDGHAIVIKMEEQVRGMNEYLNKKIIDRNFDEVLINSKGEELKYLTQHEGVLLDPKRYKEPAIMSKLLGSGIVAVKTESGHWKIIKP